MSTIRCKWGGSDGAAGSSDSRMAFWVRLSLSGRLVRGVLGSGSGVRRKTCFLLLEDVPGPRDSILAVLRRLELRRRVVDGSESESSESEDDEDVEDEDEDEDDEEDEELDEEDDECDEETDGSRCRRTLLAGGFGCGCCALTSDSLSLDDEEEEEEEASEETPRVLVFL